MRFDAVVFDLDDTLYLESDYVVSGIRAVGTELAARAAPSMVGQAVAATVDAWESRATTRPLSLLERLLAEQGISADMRELLEWYRAHQPALALPADSGSALRHLSGRVGLALKTDGRSDQQRRKIDALELGPWFDFVQVSGDAPDRWEKPRPAGFVDLLRALDCAPERACYVCDNVAKDPIGPVTLGMGVVLVRRPNRIRANSEGPRIWPGFPVVENLVALDRVLEAC